LAAREDNCTITKLCQRISLKCVVEMIKLQQNQPFDSYSFIIFQTVRVRKYSILIRNGIRPC